ncbi:MAG: sigma-70 family RNA polymerase sigma factor, partial [Verrucomicrobiae bacterium]|nr:sigma-70 family RNA polymerase sigma factor [Verrucomicrobiae bacterium]
MDDAQLLQEYIRGSETAFTLLVRRHLGLVYSVALRRVQDAALAEDVSQAVFLLLARKAARLKSGVLLSGWLFRTTCLVAANVRRKEQRRQQREQEAYAMSQTHASEGSWERLVPVIDEALGRLGETDRNALLLRFAEGRSHREVGQTLGVSEEAAKKRLQRALEKLRGLLGAHGAPVSALALATWLGERLSAASPPGLEATVSAAVRGLPSASAAAQLARQAQRAWIWTRVRFAVGVFAGAGVLLLGWLAAPQPGPTPESSSAELADAQPAVERSSPAAPASPSPSTSLFRLTVLNAENDAPIAGANVPVTFVVNREWIFLDDFFTDASGVAEIPLPEGLGRLDAGAHVAGWENRFFTWRSDWQDPLPDHYALKLNPAETLGGVVLDSHRQPVAGAEVWIAYGISDASWHEPRQDRERMGSMRRLRVGLTDRQGRWIAAVVPKARERFAFDFEHPDFVTGSLTIRRRDEDSAALNLLRDLKAETLLQPGLAITGSVVDPHGHVVTGARITQHWSDPGVNTEADGSFVIRRLPRRTHSFTAT